MAKTWIMSDSQTLFHNFNFRHSDSQEQLRLVSHSQTCQLILNWTVQIQGLMDIYFSLYVTVWQFSHTPSFNLKPSWDLKNVTTLVLTTTDRVRGRRQVGMREWTEFIAHTRYRVDQTDGYTRYKNWFGAVESFWVLYISTRNSS